MKITTANPEIVLHEGKPSAVILRIDVYEELLEQLEQKEDLKALAAARKRPMKFRSFDEFILAHRARALPGMPPADAKGYRPAIPALRASIARKIIRRRIAAGLSQRDLARRAGIRVETLSRLESGKHAPQRETIARIDKILAAIEKR